MLKLRKKRFQIKRNFVIIIVKKSTNTKNIYKNLKDGKIDGIRGKYPISMYLKTYLENIIKNVQDVDGVKEIHLHIIYH